MDQINALYLEFEQKGILELTNEQKKDISECEKCKLVTEKYLESYKKLLPDHENIKCYISINDEEELLLSISSLTGLSLLNIKQFFKDEARNKINESELTVNDNSFQYDGILYYCRISEIATDICQYMGCCQKIYVHNFEGAVRI